MFIIRDLHTSQTVATRETLQAARNRAAKLNLAYGAHRYIAMVATSTI